MCGRKREGKGWVEHMHFEVLWADNRPNCPTWVGPATPLPSQKLWRSLFSLPWSLSHKLVRSKAQNRPSLVDFTWPELWHRSFSLSPSAPESTPQGWLLSVYVKAQCKVEIGSWIRHCLTEQLSGQIPLKHDFPPPTMDVSWVSQRSTVPQSSRAEMQKAVP